MSMLGVSAGVYPLQFDTTGTTMVTSATAFTKGQYVQLTAGLQQACVALQLAMRNQTVQNVDQGFFIDIAVGASGNEIVVARDYFVGTLAFNEQVITHPIPLTVPAGVRIAARIAGSVAVAQTFSVFASTQLASALTPPGAGVVTTLGIAAPPTTLTGGGAVTCSTTQGVFGTPVLYSSAIPHTARWIKLTAVTISGPTYRMNFIKLSADSAGANQIGPVFCLPCQGGNYSDLAPFGIPILPCLIPKDSPLYVSFAADVPGYSIAYGFAIYLFG